MSFYERVFGHPFVFNRIRPLFVGGIDWTCLYVVINLARQNAVGPNIHYQCRFLDPEDVRRIRPTKVLLSGLLHHLSDGERL